MAAIVRYVKERNGVYHYERRVPEAVKRNTVLYAVHFGSKPLFRRSLRTRDRGAIHSACVAVQMEFESKVAAVMMPHSALLNEVQRVPSATLRTITQHDLDGLAEDYRRLEVEPIERAHMRADASPDYAAEYDRQIYDLELEAENKAIALAKRGVGDESQETPADIAVWVIQNRGWDAPTGTVAFGAVVGAIRAGVQKGRDEAQALLTGHAVPRLADSLHVSAASVQTLSEAVEAYLQHKKLPARTATEVRSSLRLFESLMGNKRLDSITRRDFRAYVEHLAQQVIGGKTDGSIKRLASRATLKKRIALLRAVINHAIEREVFDGPNPAANINIDTYAARSNPATMPKKRRFTDDEMGLIFQHPWFNGCSSATNTHSEGNHRLTGSEYWVPVVAALTGCRASELGGLMITEVILTGSHPHLAIRDNKYRRTKGGYARKVPILDALLDLGFADYVNAIRHTGAERVFPDWKAPAGQQTDRNDDNQWSNGKVIRSFNRTVIPTMLGSRLSPDARLEVTFHGFRGAFKAMLGRKEFGLHPNIINEVCGHPKTEMYARYVGEISIEETYPAIRECSYGMLVIPRLPQ